MEIGEVAGLTRGGGSSWQSLVRGTGSIEADYLNGEMCLLGRLHGVPTPVNELLQRRANAAAAARPGARFDDRGGTAGGALNGCCARRLRSPDGHARPDADRR